MEPHRRHPLTVSVQQRVADVLNLPAETQEHVQMLRYEPGQYYRVHHDQNSPRSSAWGPRMFTVFMYIGEGYTGGETRSRHAEQGKILRQYVAHSFMRAQNQTSGVVKLSGSKFMFIEFGRPCSL